jgi:hypothetical protein
MPLRMMMIQKQSREKAYPASERDHYAFSSSAQPNIPGFTKAESHKLGAVILSMTDI